LIDPNFPSAKIIAHSKAPNGEELITMEIELHRFILPEFNTHRSFSRNFQSSRAVPIEKMIEQVRNHPAMPVHWGKDQSGMVAESELDELVWFGDGVVGAYTKEETWQDAAWNAALIAEAMSNSGYHKQLVNRLLEPFMKTKGVVTATRMAYEAFFKLRCHKDAQPEIKLLAERMQKTLVKSKPNELQYGDYHLPYVNSDVDEMLTEEAVKISCSCAAQVSYRRLDDSLAKALKVYDMLNLPVNGVYPEDPPHFSPTEHIAKIVDAKMMYDVGLCDINTISGNFNSGVFWQYRKALEIGMEQEFLE
jgi:thymidylate synthase ThyX